MERPWQPQGAVRLLATFEQRYEQARQRRARAVESVAETVLAGFRVLNLRFIRRAWKSPKFEQLETSR